MCGWSLLLSLVTFEFINPALQLVDLPDEVVDGRLLGRGRLSEHDGTHDTDKKPDASHVSPCDRRATAECRTGSHALRDIVTDRSSAKPI
jgi:hypothetical protein